MRTTEIERVHEDLQEHAREIRRLKKWRSQVSVGDKLRSTSIGGSVPPAGGGTGIVTTAPCWYLWSNASGAIQEQGTVCVESGDRDFDVTTTPDDPLVIGVLDEAGVAIGADALVRHIGYEPVVLTVGPIASGHYLRTSATAGRAENAGTAATAGTFGWAVTSTGATGTSQVAAYLDTGLRLPANPITWQLNSNLLGSGVAVDLVEGWGVWISGSFAGGVTHYTIGAYVQGGGGASGTATLFADGVQFCSTLNLNLEAEAGIWISGTCDPSYGTFHIGAYATGPSGGLSGIDVAINGSPICFAEGIDLHEGAGLWISGSCAGGEATVELGAYPAAAPPTSISGVDALLDGGPLCFARAWDFHQTGTIWISGICAGGEVDLTFGAYPTTVPTSISGIDFELDDAPLGWGHVLDLDHGAGIWLSGSLAGQEASYRIGALVLDERPTQAVAAGTTISVTDGRPITPFTTSGNVTSTAAPFIAAGRNGQLVILRNDNGTGTLTLSDTNIGAGGSLLRLSASTVTMAAGSSMAFEYSTIQGAWVEQWYLALVSVTPAILTFTINIGAGAANAQNAEVAKVGDGQTHTPTFAWTFTGVPSSGSVDIDAGGGEVNPADYPAAISAPFTSLVGPVFYKGTAVGTVRTFTPSIVVNGVTKTTPTATITYINRRYMGPSSETAALTTAQVLGLDGAGGTSDLSTIRTGTFSVTIGGGEYLWFAYRAALGAALYLTLNGEIAEFIEKQTALAHTNDSGFAEDFRTWRATTAAVGAVTAVVGTTAGNNRFYMGPAANGTDDIGNAEVLALDDTVDGESGLYSSQARSWSAIKIEAGEYLWYCHPSRIADLATIKDGTTGFAIAGSYRNNMTHTNQYGYQETYRCWRSDNSGIYPTGESIVIT